MCPAHNPEQKKLQLLHVKHLLWSLAGIEHIWFLEFSDCVSVCSQYYYAHAPKNFSTEGAIHFKEDGKIYGGDPVLIKTYSADERV